MKSKKHVTIKTSCFELQVNWNGKFVSSQVCFIIVLLLVRTLGVTSQIRNLCSTLLILDVLVMVVLMLPGFYVNVEDVIEEPTEEVKEKSVQAQQVGATVVASVDKPTTDTTSIEKETDEKFEHSIKANVVAPKGSDTKKPKQDVDPMDGIIVDDVNDEVEKLKNAKVVEPVSVDTLFDMFSEIQEKL